MTWQDRSVSVDESSRVTFRSVLGDVTVSERGIRREDLQREDEWERIRSEMPDDQVFKGFVPWSSIDSITKRTEYLTYPHIDIERVPSAQEGRSVEERVLPDKIRIFFKEDSPDGFDEVNRCFKTIKMMWNAHRQRSKRRFLSYTYTENRSVEKISRPTKNDENSRKSRNNSHNTSSNHASKEEYKKEENNMKEILEKAASDPSAIMDRFGSENT